VNHLHPPVDLASSHFTIAAAPDGHWLATAPHASLILLWDLHQNHLVCGFHLCSGRVVLQLSFLPGDYQTLAVLTDDSCLTLLSVPSGEAVATAQLCANVDSLATERRGNYAVTVATDGTAALYDMPVLRAASPAASASTHVNRLLPHELPPSPAHSMGEGTAGGKTEPRQAAREGVIELPLAEFGDTGQRFNVEKLKKLLNACGEYPPRYRLLIWEFLLQLPRNRDAFEVLQERGPHACVDDLTRQCAPPSVAQPARLQVYIPFLISISC
jgi:hypothetical protein